MPANKHVELLGAIQGLTLKHGQPPSQQQLLVALNLRAPGALWQRLQRARGQGLLTWDLNQRRTLRLTDKGYEALVSGRTKP